jgi:hypothetical protein
VNAGDASRQSPRADAGACNLAADTEKILLAVRFHNRWEANLSLLVTILGWLLVAGGLVRKLFPLRFAAVPGDYAQSSGMMAVVAAVLLAIGAFLSFKAYASS